MVEFFSTEASFFEFQQKQVRSEMAQRQNKLNELDEMMQNLKINLTEKSATKLQKNLLLKEEQIMKVCTYLLLIIFLRRTAVVFRG